LSVLFFSTLKAVALYLFKHILGQSFFFPNLSFRTIAEKVVKNANPRPHYLFAGPRFFFQPVVDFSHHSHDPVPTSHTLSSVNRGPLSPLSGAVVRAGCPNLRSAVPAGPPTTIVATFPPPTHSNPGTLPQSSRRFVWETGSVSGVLLFLPPPFVPVPSGTEQTLLWFRSMT